VIFGLSFMAAIGLQRIIPIALPDGALTLDLIAAGVILVCAIRCGLPLQSYFARRTVSYWNVWRTVQRV
jgi:hypothetical protein